MAAPSLGLDVIATAWLYIPTLILPCMVVVWLIRPVSRDIALNLDHYYPAETLASQGEQPLPAALSMVSLLSDTTRLKAIAHSAAAQGTKAMMMALTPLTLAHHGHTLPEISVAVAPHVLGMFAFSLPLSRLCDMVGRRPVLLAGAAISVIGAFLVPSSPAYGVATAGIFPVGLGWSCSYVAASAAIADATLPAERGHAIGVNDTVSGAAAITAPNLG